MICTLLFSHICVILIVRKGCVAEESMRRIVARATHGFTILEALLAVMVAVLCSFFLFAAVNFGTTIIHDTRDHILVSTILQQETEKLRKRLYEALPPYGTTSFANASLNDLLSASGTVTAEQYGDVDITRITYTVTWSSRLSPSRTYTKSLVTLCTRNGINSL